MDSKLRKKIVPFLLPLIFLTTFSLDPLIGRAEEACYVIVRTVQKHVHHTAETLEAWGEWNKEHPNYHPATKRPNPTDALHKFNIACATFETTPSDLLLTLDPLPLPEFAFGEAPIPPEDNAPPAPFTPIDTGVLAPNYPVLVSSNNPIPSIPPIGTPIGTTPETPPVVTPVPVPEPSSLLLLLTGVLGLLAVPVIRQRKAAQIAARNR